MHESESLYEIIDRTGGYPVFVAHRGGGCEFGPENTLHSCRNAAAHFPHVRMLEVDIRVTKDDRLILMHDSSVDRTTDGQGAVCDYTLENIRRLDAAHNYPKLRGRGVRVPTLDEFLEEFVGDDAAAHKDLLFMFDFKDERAIELAWPLIHSYSSIKGRYILGSVFATPNALLRQWKYGETPVATDISQTFAITIAHGTGLGWLYHYGDHQIFGYVLQSKSDLFFTASLIKTLHDNGLKIMVCGPNLAQPSVMNFCLENAVEFIVIDCPHMLPAYL